MAQTAAEKKAAADKVVADALSNFLSGASAQGVGKLTLPSAAQLHANGVSASDATKYGGTQVNIPTVGPTGGNLSVAQSMRAVLNALPQTISNATMQVTGLDDTSLGKTFAERVSAITPQLVDGKNNLGSINIPNAARDVVQKAELTNIQGLLATGDQAAMTGATQSAMYSAEANVDSTLAQWGLNSPRIVNLVKQLATNPAGAMTNPNEILNQIRQTPEYKQAFPGLTELNASPTAVHLTESQYQQHSEQYLGMAQQAGIQLNQADIGKLVQGNVSPSEYQQRVNDIYNSVKNADTNTKAILQKEYGVNTNDLVHYMATGSLPDKQRQIASAQIQNYATSVGLTGLNQTGAEQLAGMAQLSATSGNNPLGVGVSGIKGSLLNASRDANLTGFTPGGGVQTIDTNTLIGSQIAGFGGTTQVAAQTAVQRAEQSAAAPFEKGGGYAESAKGVVGLGAARV